MKNIHRYILLIGLCSKISYSMQMWDSNATEPTNTIFAGTNTYSDFAHSHRVINFSELDPAACNDQDIGDMYDFVYFKIVHGNSALNLKVFKYPHFEPIEQSKLSNDKQLSRYLRSDNYVYFKKFLGNESKSKKINIIIPAIVLGTNDIETAKTFLGKISSLIVSCIKELQIT